MDSLRDLRIPPDWGFPDIDTDTAPAILSGILGALMPDERPEFRRYSVDWNASLQTGHGFTQLPLVLGRSGRKGLVLYTNYHTPQPRRVDWIRVRDVEPPRQWIAQRYPRVVSHMICHSLGYATPATAASIVWAGHTRKVNWCEWIASCYGGDAREALIRAVGTRHCHHGYMAEIRQARRLVTEFANDGSQPELASWF